jgi:hypothetical protein
MKKGDSQVDQTTKIQSNTSSTHADTKGKKHFKIIFKQ